MRDTCWLAAWLLAGPLLFKYAPATGDPAPATFSIRSSGSAGTTPTVSPYIQVTNDNNYLSDSYAYRGAFWTLSSALPAAYRIMFEAKVTGSAESFSVHWGASSKPTTYQTETSTAASGYKLSINFNDMKYYLMYGSSKLIDAALPGSITQASLTNGAAHTYTILVNGNNLALYFNSIKYYDAPQGMATRSMGNNMVGVSGRTYQQVSDVRISNIRILNRRKRC